VVFGRGNAPPTIAAFTIIIADDLRTAVDPGSAGVLDDTTAQVQASASRRASTWPLGSPPIRTTDCLAAGMLPVTDG
jgi:hypothetical protein